ncbi:hypothetical protein AB0383_22855 [Amycolatopsis sp. NPDC051373]|uniref:hypothetical protein n=1 Tax=Amycolatopsis sp. NPDC051373 TaxID=3155801 RepID=UPI00344B79CA
MLDENGYWKRSEDINAMGAAALKDNHGSRPTYGDLLDFGKWLGGIAYKLSPASDVENCADNGSALPCTSAAMGIFGGIFGKLGGKILGKLGKLESLGAKVAKAGPLAFKDSFAGDNLIRDVYVSGVQIRVESGHGYRSDHAATSADITSVLDRDVVDSAVARDLAARVGAGTQVATGGKAGASTFQIALNGYNVGYRAVYIPQLQRYDIPTYWIP